MPSEAFYQEDLGYLERWMVQVRTRAEKVHELAREKKQFSFFSIGTTAKPNNFKPFLTPIRNLESGVLSGVIVFSQSQAILAAKIVDGLVDKVLVDAEKKIGINVDVSYVTLKHFNVPVPAQASKSRSNIEMGNISSVVTKTINKSELIQYKPNDITADSVWSYISLKLKNLSGKKAAIIGCGNIGFKLALKLVESGMNVELVRRDPTKGMLMANAINVSKPDTTIAKASFNYSPLQASIFCNVLIGASPGVPVITWDMIQSMSPDGFIIDIGKGTIEKEAIQKAFESKIEIVRADVTPGIYGFISQTQQMRFMIESSIGSRQVTETFHVVSVGVLGANADIIVDNYVTPREIYGVCDGSGDVKNELSEADKKNIEYLKRLHSIK